ncbi:MAG: hypothetical protein IT518_25060 [Burkholderiales bacterium]|nr:hypothetical protein [Burkholderiales bacterium]
MLHEGQQRILARAQRWNAVACGRRFGKTTLGLALAAAGAPHAPGGLLAGYDVGWFAPTYKLLDDAFRAARVFLRAYERRVDSQQKRLELVTGSALDFWTLEDTDAGRGRRYGLVIVDEAAMARNLQAIWEQAIRPTLADYQGGAWFFSTPKGRNYFHALYARHGIIPGWCAHHAPTSANPYIPATEIEEARRTLPERVFLQEYEAAFLDDGGGVFRHVLAAVDEDLLGDPSLAVDATDGRGFVIGVDWGRHNDFTVFTVVDARRRAVVAVDRFTDIEYGIQLGRLKALHSRFRLAPILAESNAMGEPLIEQLRRDGLPVRAFQTTAVSKAAAVEALALAFERREIRIPKIPALVDELLAFDQERLPSGAIRYRAPEGQHDDCVMSLAIAWHGLTWGAPIAAAAPRETVFE